VLAVVGSAVELLKFEVLPPKFMLSSSVTKNSSIVSLDMLLTFSSERVMVVVVIMVVVTVVTVDVVREVDVVVVVVARLGQTAGCQ